MRIYLGSFNQIFIDVTKEARDDNYRAPEVQTVFIGISDLAGCSFSFRLQRDAYDQFRKKILETEGYK